MTRLSNSQNLQKVVDIVIFNGNFSPIIKETMDLLSNYLETAHIFRTPKLVPSRRQPPNLKKLLTRASLNTNIRKHCKMYW